MLNLSENGDVIVLNRTALNQGRCSLFGPVVYQARLSSCVAEAAAESFRSCCFIFKMASIPLIGLVWTRLVTSKGLQWLSFHYIRCNYNTFALQKEKKASRDRMVFFAKKLLIRQANTVRRGGCWRSKGPRAQAALGRWSPSPATNPARTYQRVSKVFIYNFEAYKVWELITQIVVLSLFLEGGQCGSRIVF